MAAREVDIEPCYYGVDEVVALDVEEEFAGECKIRGGALVEIEFEDLVGISDDSLELDGVDQRLGKRGVFQGAIIKTVDIIPDCAWLANGECMLCGSSYIQSFHPCNHRPQYQP